VFLGNSIISFLLLYININININIKKKLGLTEFLLDSGLRPYHPRSGLIMIQKTMVSPAADRPHAIVMPCPFLYRIKTILKLAKLFHHRGFHITFVNTEFNQHRFLKSRVLIAWMVCQFQFWNHAWWSPSFRNWCQPRHTFSLQVHHEQLLNSFLRCSCQTESVLKRSACDLFLIVLWHSPSEPLNNLESL
jgi:hypothetical protein